MKREESISPLTLLMEQGQRWWIDDLTRDMIKNGDLERWRREGLSGVTSNPSIFHKAISRGNAYDEQVAALYRERLSPSQVYEEVVTTDVRDACDVLRPVYEESGGADGYVSLEVSPHLAYDTAGSLREARHLHAKVDRPNLFIKVPGTAAGIPAIEQLSYEGININVTLLFSIDVYEATADAFMRGLERRAQSGGAVDSVCSVASFFVSRVDTLVDTLLASRINTESYVGSPPLPRDLLGKAAVANAKSAYQRYKRIIGGERWGKLAVKGAKPQRIVWASTSTKNPRYSDLMYVEPLIGRDTINTLPLETLAAFRDHGRVRPDAIEEGSEELAQVVDDLERLGIRFKAVTDQLEKEGVQKFMDSYDALLDLMSARRLD